MNASFTTHHHTTRLLEQSLDSKFSSLSRLYQSQKHSTLTNAASAQLASLLSDIQKDIGALEALNDTLHGCQDVESHSHTQTAALERHRDLLSDYQVEYERMRRVLREATQRSELFDGATSTAENASDSYSGAQHMTRESDRRLAGANAQLHSILQLGQNTHLDLEEQRQRFGAMNATLSAMRQQFPMMDAILTRIAGRQRRDTIILAAVIAFFIVVAMGIIF